MALIPINIGTAPDDGSGDTLRAAMAKVNSAFSQIDANTEEIEGLNGVENEVLRVSWVPPGTSTLTPAVANVPEPLIYTHVPQTSPHVTANISTGELILTRDVDVAILQINVQAAKTSGVSGDDIWGVYVQIDTGGGWVDMPDTLRVASVGKFEGSVAGLTYTVSTGPIQAGTKYRLMHIKNTEHDIGPYTDRPWPNAPAAPGIVIAIDTLIVK